MPTAVTPDIGQSPTRMIGPLLGWSVVIQPSLEGQQGCFDAAPDMQLCEDARHVVLDGFFGQVQAFTYLSIRQAFPDELQDLALTFGELWRSEFNRRGCARARPELYGAPVVPSRSHPGPSTRGRIGG